MRRVQFISALAAALGLIALVVSERNSTWLDRGVTTVIPLSGSGKLGIPEPTKVPEQPATKTGVADQVPNIPLAPSAATHPISWDQFGAKSTLASLFDQAKRTGTSKDINSLFVASAQCPYTHDAPSIQKSIRLMSEDLKRPAVGLRMKESLDRLKAVCSDLPDEHMQIYQSAAYKAGFIQQLHRNERSNPQAYQATVVQLLSNPSADPASFDLWLTNKFWEKTLIGAKSEFTNEQKNYFEDALYARFFPNESDVSFRRLARCARLSRCDGLNELTPDQGRIVDELVAQVDGAIRTQRWGVIFGR